MKLSEYKLAVVDLETTGLDPQRHEIIEVGLILYSQKKDKILKRWCKKVKPLNIRTASKYALEINGYNKNPHLYTNDIKDTLEKLNKATKRCILVGQNISFDISFIKRYMSKYNIKPLFSGRYVELMGLAWPVIRENLENMSLKDLCNRFGVSNKDAHSALVDCERTLEIYKRIMKGRKYV